MCVCTFSKLALVCISYHCGAWYAFHTTAEIVWHHTVLSYQQKGSDFGSFMTLKEGNLWYKFEGPSCYGNRVVYSFHSAMVWNAYHALQWYEMYTSANFEKSILNRFKPPVFSKHQIWTKSKTFWKLVSSDVLSEVVLYKVVSSAYKYTDIGESFNEGGRSLIRSKNKKEVQEWNPVGPRIKHPWPFTELQSLMTTCWVLLLR